MFVYYRTKIFSIFLNRQRFTEDMREFLKENFEAINSEDDYPIQAIRNLRIPLLILSREIELCSCYTG